jgi:hypothetical protein
MLKIFYKLWMIILVLLSCSSLLSIMAINRVAEVSGWQIQAFRVIDKAENLLSNLKDAEVGQRGYLLTNNERFLEPYFTASPLIDVTFAELQGLIKDKPQQQLDKLKPPVADRTSLLNKTLSIHQNYTADEALEIVKKGQGRALMDSIRLVLKGLISNEQNQLNQQSTELAFNIRYLLLGITASAFLVVMVAGSSTYQIRRLSEEIRRKAAFQATLLDSVDAAIISPRRTASSPASIADWSSYSVTARRIWSTSSRYSSFTMQMRSMSVSTNSVRRASRASKPSQPRLSMHCGKPTFCLSVLLILVQLGKNDAVIC